MTGERGINNVTCLVVAVGPSPTHLRRTWVFRLSQGTMSTLRTPIAPIFDIRESKTSVAKDVAGERDRGCRKGILHGRRRTSREQKVGERGITSGDHEALMASVRDQRE